jgi:hypothetical protein
MSRSDYKKLYEGYIDNTTSPLPIGFKIDSSFKVTTPSQPVKVNSPVKPSPPVKVTLPVKNTAPTPTKVTAPTPTKVTAQSVKVTVPTPTKVTAPTRIITQDIIDRFLNLVYSFNDNIWTDCGNSGQLAKLQTNEFYPAMDIVKNLGIDNIVIKETDKSLTILKLCSSNTILNNRTDIANGPDVISLGDNGPILPFKRSTFKIDDKKRNSVCEKLLKYINNQQKWSSCNTTDMFQQFTSSCEIDLNTNFTKIVDYVFDDKNKNPHIIQLIDMCRPMLKLKFEISYNSTTKKIIFYKFCKENIDKKIVPYL